MLRPALLQFMVRYGLYSRVGPVILGPAESTMPWVYCYSPISGDELI